jgi:hypothetical protein
LPADTPIRASTQEFLSVEDIQDDIVLLKEGSCALILQVTAVNFGLLSEGEQDAMIYAYAGLLNSLSFPVQIVIRSKKKDISSYLQLLKDQETKIKKPILIEQMRKYRAFVEATVKENEVLDKKFYVSIPFSILELGVTSTLSQAIKTKKGLPYPKSYIFERAKTNLYPKRDHLMGQLRRLGVKSRQLTTQELLQLVYSIYNPESVGQQFVPTKDYTTPMVQAATTQLPIAVPGTNLEPAQPPKEVFMNDQPTTPPPSQVGSQPGPMPAPTGNQPAQPSTSAPMVQPTTPPASQGQGTMGAPTPMGGQPTPQSAPPAPAPGAPAPDPTEVDASQMQSTIDSAVQQASNQPAPRPPLEPKPGNQPMAAEGQGQEQP